MSDYDRAKSVLRLLAACEKSPATARAVMLTAMSSGQFNDTMSAHRAMQDWKLSVHWVLRRVGLLGSTILVYRLTRQQNSQSNSFLSIAKAVGLGKASTELMFDASLAIFIREMTDRKIPDAFWELPESMAIALLCAARELGEPCPVEAA